MTGAGVILVRHALPHVEPGIPSRAWRLTNEAREDCVRLAQALPAGIVAPVRSSGQPKTDETAAIIALQLGLSTAVDERLREVDQPDRWYEGDYRALAAGYLERRTPEGWEPRQAVAERFAAAVGEALEGAAGEVLVVNHGLAMTLYLELRAPAIVGPTGVAPFVAAPFWRTLGFPDAWRLDLARNELLHVFGGARTPE